VEPRMDFAQLFRDGEAWDGCAVSFRGDLPSPRGVGRARELRRSGPAPETPWPACMRPRKMRPKQFYATLMPPHDNCYTRRATVSVRFSPMPHASKRGMTIQ